MARRGLRRHSTAMLAPLILLFTDFGVGGPYAGQVKAVLSARIPKVPVIDLMHDAPAHDPRAAAYLLAALAPESPPGCIFLGIVDPGVGTEARRPVIVQADGRWFVGPGNGLFNVVAVRAGEVSRWDITWTPERELSASFHGRDLFAPVAAMLARGEAPPGVPAETPAPTDAWPGDLCEVIYIDRFGNAMTGVRASSAIKFVTLSVNGVSLRRARTFGEVPRGEGFWYANSIGLVEIAINQGRANDALGLEVGTSFALV